MPLACLWPMAGWWCRPGVSHHHVPDPLALSLRVSGHDYYYYVGYDQYIYVPVQTKTNQACKLVNRRVKWTLCCFLCQLSDLPLELLETVLMRTFVMLGKSRDSERHAFIMLASVCSEWRYGLTGWPQSPTPLWVRHQLKKLIKRECTCSTLLANLP